MVRILLLFISLFSLPTVFGADLSFDVRDSDLSLNYLRMLFGTIEGAIYGQGSLLMGRIFGIFNSALLTVAGMILLYILIISTVNTAQSGEVMGKSWSSIWIPMRAAIGIALLLPKASGYCTIQGIIMWLIIQGIGAANSVWDTALDYLESGSPLIAVDVSGTGINTLSSEASGMIQPLAEFYLTASSCMASLEKELNDKVDKKRDNIYKQLDQHDEYDRELQAWTAAGNSPPVIKDGQPLPAPTATRENLLKQLDTLPIIPNFEDTVSFSSNSLDGGNHTIKFPGDFGTGQEYYTQAYKGVCGKVELEATTKPEANIIKMISNEALYSSMSSLGSSYVSDEYEPIEDEDQAMAVAIVAYYYSMAVGKEYFRTGGSSTVDWNGARNRGWLSAATIYYDMVRSTAGAISLEASYMNVTPTPNASFASNTKTSLEKASSKPSVVNEDSEVDKVNSKVMSSSSNLQQYISNNAENWNDDRYSELSASSDTSSLSNNPDSTTITIIVSAYAVAFAGIMTAMAAAVSPGAGIGVGIALAATGIKSMVAFNSLISGGSSSPIVDLAILGSGMMDMATATFTAAALGVLGGVMGASALAGWNPAPFAFIATAAMVGPIFAILMTLLMGGGAMLFLYVPVIPAIVYLFSAIGWFFAVLEAIAAAPLVAIGIIHPEGHEAFGKSEAAIMLALNVFLRPTLMVIAFIMASMLSHMSIWLLNHSFSSVLVRTLANPAAIGPGLAVAVPILIVMYGMLIIWLLQTVFEMVPKLPDEILKWIGGAVTSYSTGTASGKAQQMGSTVQGAGSQIGGAMAQGVQQAGKLEQKQQDSETEVEGAKGDGDGNSDPQMGGEVGLADGGGDPTGGGDSGGGKPKGGGDPSGGGISGGKSGGKKDSSSGGGGNSGPPSGPKGGGSGGGGSGGGGGIGGKDSSPSKGDNQEKAKSAAELAAKSQGGG